MARLQVSRSEIDAGMTASRPRPEVATWFVGHGYIVVYQDCRGRYASEGEFVKYLSDGEDGYDTSRGLLTAMVQRQDRDDGICRMRRTRRVRSRA